jgi:acetoin utilization protein AcuB
MRNEQIISPQIAALEYNQTVGDALDRMDTLAVDQLPVIKDGIYEGLLQEEDLLDAGSNDLLSNFQADLLPFAVKAEDHFLSAAKLLATQRLKVVPVISADKEYVGTISEEDLLRQFARLNGVQEMGALIVLAISHSDYSISQLSRLVETNDSFITQLNTFTDDVTGQLIVTIRLNKQEVSDVLATFQRYDYQVIFHAGEEQYENELRRNYNHLMTFLEI